MSVVLWHIELSHYNEKVRWALDFKGVPHERRAPLPGLHGGYAAVLTRGGQRRLPVLDLDGRRVGDSTAIIAALEERFPHPPLYPSDPDDRARALELEDFFDEHLARPLRSFVWHHTLLDTDAVVDAVLPTASRRRRRIWRAFAPAMAPVVRRDYGAKESTAADARAEVVAAMDRLESELQPSGYLVGDRFTVADLTGAALFYPLVLPPEGPLQMDPPATVASARASLEDRRGYRYVQEMYAHHRARDAPRTTRRA